ncbi:hypothetical protein C8R44DRAFT_751192 [Mycena epipterygia]|nr:hypothetical protein C8R44DRAFT_751192 [Mycena epipterygia]
MSSHPFPPFSKPPSRTASSFKQILFAGLHLLLVLLQTPMTPQIVPGLSRFGFSVAILTLPSRVRIFEMSIWEMRSRMTTGMPGTLEMDEMNDIEAPLTDAHSAVKSSFFCPEDTRPHWRRSQFTTQRTLSHAVHQRHACGPALLHLPALVLRFPSRIPQTPSPGMASRWRPANAQSPAYNHRSAFSRLLARSPDRLRPITHPSHAAGINLRDNVHDASVEQTHRRFITDQAPWRLGYICRFWREAAVSYPFIWSTIHIFNSLSEGSRPLLMIESQLLRSANAPLGVMIDWNGYPNPLHPYLDSLCLHSDQWSTLKITGATNNAFKLLLAQGQLRLLKRLELNIQQGGVRFIPSNFPLLIAPSLRKVSLTGPNFRDSSSNLLHFRGRYPQAHQMEVLRAALNLVRCSIDFNDKFRPHGDAVVTLPVFSLGIENACFDAPQSSVTRGLVSIVRTAGFNLVFHPAVLLPVNHTNYRLSFLRLYDDADQRLPDPVAAMGMLVQEGMDVGLLGREEWIQWRNDNFNQLQLVEKWQRVSPNRLFSFPNSSRCLQLLLRLPNA